MTLVPDGLSSVADHYDVLLCDVWGVIHNGLNSFVEPCRALSMWRDQRGPVILISNSPRPSADVILQLDQLGVPRAAWSTLVTSGDVTRALLAERSPGPAYRIGPERDSALYEGLGLEFTSIELAKFISCTGPVDDEIETPEDYREVFLVGVSRGMDLICANPDRMVQRGDKKIYCGGALADLYDSLGGCVFMAGKPYAPIYQACFAKAHELLGRSISTCDVLAIGDGMATDLKGAMSQDIDAVFIASGIHAAAILGDNGNLMSQKLITILSDNFVTAKYAMAELNW